VVHLCSSRLRPVRLLNAAVTNDPNLKGMVPLSNRSGDPPQAVQAGGQVAEKVDFGTKSEGGHEPSASCASRRVNMKKVIEALVNRLGLATDAKEEDVLVAMEKLTSGDDFSALQNSLTEAQGEKDALAKDVESLEQELVNRDLAEFEDVISDATRSFWTEQLIQNREGARGALGELVSQRSVPGDQRSDGDGRQGTASPTKSGTKKPLHNRREARPANRGSDGAPAVQPGNDNLAVKIRNRAHELCKGEGIAFSVAFRRAERELIGD
jgi:hypothetical protein